MPAVRKLKATARKLKLVSDIAVFDLPDRAKTTITPSNFLERLKTEKRSNIDNTFYTEHIDKLNELLQFQLNLYGDLGIKLKIKVPNAPDHRLKNLINQGQFLENSQIFNQQIETFAEVVYEIITHPERSQIIIGSTQLGKTMIMILCFILEAVMATKFKHKYKAIYFGPNNIALDAQTKKDMIEFLSFYDFEVTVNGENPVLYSEYKKEVPFLTGDDETLDLPIFRRSCGKNHDISPIFKSAHDDKIKLILIMDECHWGSHFNGNMKKILSSADFSGDIMIAISATPFNLSGLEGLTKIFCKTYEGYVGYAFFKGYLLDSRHKLILPTVLAYNSQKTSVRFNTPQLHFVDRKLYRNKKSYEKEKEKNQNSVIFLKVFLGKSTKYFVKIN